MGAAILEVEDLTKHYPVGKAVVRALAGVHPAVAPGESVAIVGESGSGKTTLAKLVLGVEAPSAHRGRVQRALAPLCRDVAVLGAGGLRGGRSAAPGLAVGPQPDDGPHGVVPQPLPHNPRGQPVIGARP